MTFLLDLLCLGGVGCLAPAWGLGCPRVSSASTSGKGRLFPSPNPGGVSGYPFTPLTSLLSYKMSELAYSCPFFFKEVPDAIGV